MHNSTKTIAITSLVSLFVGILAGFIPEHLTNTTLQQQMQSLTKSNNKLQSDLVNTRNQLSLSNFAVRSAAVLTDAEQNNYSVASANASSLFTDMRAYADVSDDEKAKEQLSQILADRDRIIAGLAKADPGVKQILFQTFRRLRV